MQSLLDKLLSCHFVSILPFSQFAYMFDGGVLGVRNRVCC